jgi:hypothetical protein
MFLPCPLLYVSNALFEKLKAKEVAHHTISKIDLSGSICTVCLDTPAYQVVLKDALVKLVKNIWHDGIEYV